MLALLSMTIFYTVEHSASACTLEMILTTEKVTKTSPVPEKENQHGKKFSLIQNEHH